MTIEQIIAKVQENDPLADVAKLQRAYDFALAAHQGQYRKTGEPYIEHPLHTAYILAQIRADLPTVIAGILHDVPEDTTRTLEELKAEFGEDIATMVEGITKLSKVKYRGVDRYNESLRKMFLAMASDLRVIMIKFADRLHNLRTLEGLPKEKRVRIAKETMEIYAPIAGLLGIWRLRWQLEDICFKQLFPEEYKKLEYKYEIEKKVELNQYINKLKIILEKRLTAERVQAEISGRFKHLYSIYLKMQNKQRRFDEIYDVFALRVVVETVADCYKVLGIIHTIWRPNYTRFKDYIAVPKPNGYQSLHTTVYGPEGKATEFQIRTRKMNEEALYGISAHWYYKEGSNGNKEKAPAWIKEILNAQRDAKDSGDFMQMVKLNALSDRIFVFTPKGDVYDFPQGATPIDFAYAVHTDIGNKCMACNVNNQHMPLDHILKNGDVVEIIIDKNRKGPNSDWLKFAKTKRAQEKIREFARKYHLPKIQDFKKYIPGLKNK